MNALAPDPRWLAALTASADQPPARPRLPLVWGPHRIGSVEPDYLDQIAVQPLSNLREALQKEECLTGPQWRVLGDEQQLPRLPEIEIALHRAPGTLAPAVALLEAQLVEAVQMDRPMAARDAQRQDDG